MYGTYFYSDFLDWDGNPIAKTPHDYNYSYDAYVTHRKYKDSVAKHTVYSDRLMQWDREKHDKLCRSNFGNQSQWWDGRSPEEVESFLRDYYDNPDLELVGIMKGCNVSNGFPYWIFKFNADL